MITITCCICFTGVPETDVWKCPNCGVRWDMDAACGDKQGCLDCQGLTS